mmetsp:Transcript_50164/g.160563  ORF Transcript_50164/g.160563 Transcript_50164/m.160563 type:complete len:346 (-) Transcript_50164:145-1182(-)
MAPALMIGCCKCSLAMVAVFVAVIVSVLFEKPVVTELATPEAASTASSQAARGVGGSGGVHDGAPRGAPEPGPQGAPRMGSGSMFDRIAFVYDSTNKWMSLGLDQYWRKTLIQECMQLQRGDRVLDLATGTADVGLLAGNRLQQLSDGSAPKDSVLGVDPSSEMLRRGVAKVGHQGLDGVVRLVKGDAQNLTEVRGINVEGTLAAPTAGVASKSINKISMSFGIRNVPDRARALQEMRRVLRDLESSRVCILEFSLPDGSSFLSRVARGFITHVVPAIGRVTTLGSGSAEYEYLEKSILQFPRPLDFAASMAREGLPVRSITSFAYGAVHLYAASPVAGAGPSQL